ncbi:MAG: sigma-70 family RNA polymerase sigma factor [bacterium]|nr:sigma-70 family RNA polymerase sigma factor [bacterium]
MNMRKPKIDAAVEEFTDIYKNLYPLVFSTIYSRTSNVDTTKDICQEVFTRFYERFDRVDNHRTWLYTTTRYVLFEYYRKNSKKSINIDDLFEDVSLSFVNGFKDTRIIIKEALDNIENFDTEEDHTLFDLIAVHHFSYSEAGKYLGMTKRQVQYKYGQIKKRITEYLEKKGITSLEDLL